MLTRSLKERQTAGFGLVLGFSALAHATMKTGPKARFY